MGKTALTTEFICVATSGKTADGRFIRAEHLQEMAESYDPDVYTAQIWLEHHRFLTFGQVNELKTEVGEDGKVRLFAKLQPNHYLMDLNKEGRGIFTSVEISPKFADTGKAYLVGLAVTDSPASLGTTRIQFSKQHANTEFSEPIELKFSLDTEQDENTEKITAFKKLFNWLFTEEPEQATNADKGKQTTDKDVFNDMTKEELTSVIANAVAQAFSQLSVAQPEEKSEQEPAPEAEDKYCALEAKFNALEAKFNTLAQTETEEPDGANPVVTDKFNVDFAV